MTRFVRIPILPPNAAGGVFGTGAWFVGSAPEGVAPYPEGTQTHAFIDPRAVTAIVPHIVVRSPSQTEETVRCGCHIFLVGNANVTYCHLDASEAAALFEDSLARAEVVAISDP
jgi:hypothetical protein